MERKRFAHKPANMQYGGHMPPQRTTASQPIALRIADDLRIQMETGKLRSGEPLPTLHELARDYDCGLNSARSAIELLKHQGLVIGGRGKPPTVRSKPTPVERSSERHQEEKNLVKQPEDVRSRQGLAENDMGSSLDKFEFEAKYSMVAADADLADAFRVQEGTSLFRREYVHRDKRTGALAAESISWLPSEFIEANPAIADLSKAAWPGGTMHQLYTVGIEIDRVVDYVTAAMPTTVEAQSWDLPTGTPLLRVRRISIDTNDRVVEVSDAQYPADRTMLTFHTQLTRWDDDK